MQIHLFQTVIRIQNGRLYITKTNYLAIWDDSQQFFECDLVSFYHWNQYMVTDSMVGSSRFANGLVARTSV